MALSQTPNHSSSSHSQPLFLSPSQLQPNNNNNNNYLLQSQLNLYNFRQQQPTPSSSSLRNTFPGSQFFISGRHTTPHQDITSSSSSAGRMTASATPNLNFSSSDTPVGGQCSTPVKHFRLKKLARAKIMELQNQEHKKDHVGSEENLEYFPPQQQDASYQSYSLSAPCRKRNRCPGFRIRGSRIFDSENGRTCHQCRQKTMDFVVSCKNLREEKRGRKALCRNLRGEKRCRNMYCHRCLLNRYKEKAEEVDQLNDWKCPKCREICDCSLCMRRRGLQPIRFRSPATNTAELPSVPRVPNVNGPQISSRAVHREKASSTKENISAADVWPDVGPSNFKKAHLCSEAILSVSIKEVEKTKRVDGGDKNTAREKLKNLARSKMIMQEKSTERVGGSDKNTPRVRLKNLARAKMIMQEKSTNDDSLLMGRKDYGVRQPVESATIAEADNQDKSPSSNKITPLAIRTMDMISIGWLIFTLQKELKLVKGVAACVVV